MRARAVIMDVDGVLWVDGQPGPHAQEFLDNLERTALPYRLLTNDASVSRATRARMLHDGGLSFDPDHLLTAPVLTATFLSKRRLRRVIYLGAPDAAEDIACVAQIVTRGHVDAVVVGDLFSTYTREDVERAAQALLRGAELIAIQRNRFWHDGKVSRVDNGFWVAGFEFLAGRQALVAGKPSADAYVSTLRGLEADSWSESVLMISDDLESDLAGASSLGLLTLHLNARDSIDQPPPWLTMAASDLTEAWNLLTRESDD